RFIFSAQKINPDGSDSYFLRKMPIPKPLPRESRYLIYQKKRFHLSKRWNLYNIYSKVFF
ncbi:hypothetical protein, partial [Draconibacterium sp.]|uniref:hypothetical protein n=1 Tax=Draconibacterium sp. TaxID=1965318 RepID=UPI0035634BE2